MHLQFIHRFIIYFFPVPMTQTIIHSVRNDVTGLAIAALIAWKLIVIIVITIAATAAIINTTGPMPIL